MTNIGDRNVDAVVVNYNASAYLRPCIESLLTEPVDRIIVVDNASGDSSEAVVGAIQARRTPGSLPEVVWLPMGRNLGFGRAANRGLAATSGAYVLLLNPDAAAERGAVDILRGAMEADSGIGVAGPEVTNLDGTRYPSARAFPNLVDAMAHGAFGLIAPRNRWSARYRTPDRVDWVSGTAMLLRRSAVEQIGGFDEAYFMYVEDVDLCRRLHDHGWKVAYVSGATVRHRIGGSSEQRPYRMIVAHHRSLWRYAVSSTRGTDRLALPLVAVGLVARSVVAAASRAIRRKPPAAT